MSCCVFVSLFGLVCVGAFVCLCVACGKVCLCAFVCLCVSC